MKISKTLVLLSLFSLSAFAAKDLNPEAHTHGEGNITLVYQDGLMLMELQSPAANMLGFEHEPSTEQERKQYKTLAKALKSPENFVELQPACKLKIAELKLPFEEDADHKEHKDHGHGEKKEQHDDKHHHEKAHKSKEEKHHDHDHEAEHKKSEHKAHDDHEGHGDHDDHEAHGSEHQDIHGQYEWSCAKKPLSKMTFNIFKVYPGFEKIKLQWIVNGKQGATVLTKDKNIFELSL